MIARAAGILVLVLAGIGVVLQIANGGAEAPNGRDYTPAILVASVAFGLPGAVLAARGRAPRLGWVSLGIGVSLGLGAAVGGWFVASDAEAALWLSSWCWMPGYCAIPTLLPLLLPDGRLPGPRWRPVGAAAVAAIVLVAAGQALSPYVLDDLPRAAAGHSNPLEAEPVGGVLLAAGIALLIPTAVLSIASLVLRWRTARAVERAQLKWVALGAVGTALLLAAAFAAGGAGDVVLAAAMVPLPAGVAIAVLRHRLWDVDLVVSRSLVYGALTAIVVALYVALVSALGGLIDDTAAGIVAVGVVAVALEPLHRRLRRWVNQLVYGDRDDPGAALRRLGDRLVAAGEPDEVLPAVAETVARALRLPYVEVRADGGRGAAYGAPAGEPLTVTLLYRGQREGELVAAPREPGRGFSAADRRTLEAVGRQVAVAAHAVRLARDLRGSRERLVLAREEERRRLRRDLHDELGPTLAALALELETARADPDHVDATLERAALRAREAVADVRRLVHDLRPPTLDELGLVGALREQAHRLSASVDAPDDLGPLPAAVEAAAYRIASEALANAVRHAGATTCVVGLARENGRLEVWVRDDGSGIAADARAGVGLVSMRERAEELGGTLEVTGGDGTEVRAIIPVP